jgi:RNase P/RNase MRP subunit p29
VTGSQSMQIIRWSTDSRILVETPIPLDEMVFQTKGHEMRRQRVGLAVLTCLLAGAPARADGLVFQLPPDGTWARYTMKTEATFGLKGRAPQKVTIDGTLTLSSVGELLRNEQKCRWLELKVESQGQGVHPKLLLKLLIPEDYLRRGHDPLSHAVLTFFNPKPVDRIASLESFIDEGVNRIQYEIDRFRDVFPKPLDNARSLKRETVDTPAGKFEDCEIVSGTSGYDGPLLNNGRSVFKAGYRLVLHPRAPFGVVAMQTEMEGAEIGRRGRVSLTAKKTLTLTTTGKKAVSELQQGTVENAKKSSGRH